MNPAVENIMTLADRDLAAGRYADAEREYGRALELDCDLYAAVHGRGVARTWQSTLLSGDPVALIASTQDALAMAKKAGEDVDELLDRVADDIIGLTIAKYDELTHIYHLVARKENTVAPSPLFYYTWDLSHPDGLALTDLYIPVINYLAALIQVSEFLDSILEGKEEMKRRRLLNVGNLAVFYDWLIDFNSTGKVSHSYYRETIAKKNELLSLRQTLESECAEPALRNVPRERPEGRPLPGVSVNLDKDRKIARFGPRPPFEVICPICGTVQKSNRSVCFRCSCTFIYDDEI